MRWALVLAWATLVSGAPVAAKTVSPTLGAETFPRDELVEGSTATAELCAALPLAVWVVVEGQGDCIRYYAAGLAAGGNREALVYFQGDRLAKRTMLGAYDQDSPDILQAEVNARAREARRPYLFLARPGTYGSSGKHTERRRPREGLLVDAALQAIKTRHTIGTFHLAGQSGGGGLVATMVNMRQDIGCAIVASGAVSVFLRARLIGLGDKDATGFTDSYDPVDHVGEIVRQPGLRLLVLSDRRDQTVPYESQEHYVTQLRKAGLPVAHLSLTAVGSMHHDLSVHAKAAMIWCAEGKLDGDIEQWLKTPGLHRR